MTKLMTFAKRLWKNEEGATAIEYGLLAALVAVAIITALGLVSTELNNTFGTVTTELQNAQGGTGGTGGTTTP